MGSIKESSYRSAKERGDCINPTLRSWGESTSSGSSGAIAFRRSRVDFLYPIDLHEELVCMAAAAPWPTTSQDAAANYHATIDRGTKP